jgi:hypothetical protein
MTARRASAFLGGVALFLLLCVGAAGATPAARVATVSRCPGPNAEPEQAVEGRYVYEAWIGCRKGIGFSRSVDGGRTFGPTRLVPGSWVAKRFSGWDPAVAVAPDGTVYVSFMIDSLVTTQGGGSMREMTPAVAVSHDHGKSFGQVSHLPVPTPTTPPGNWGDRPFIAVGPTGTVYVTWDYGPRADEVEIVCHQSGSCSFAGGDFNAVIQKSSDGGVTWTMPAPVSPDFPHGGVYSAPIVAEPDGALDVVMVQHPTDPDTLAVSPGGEAFTRSIDGGTTWSSPVAVDPGAGTVSLEEWWIDGSIAVDPAGNIYVAWDTQSGSRDTAWLAWSSDHGERWSSRRRVASSRAEHLVAVTAAGTGHAYVAWQTPVRRKGYATFLRRFSIGRGWTARAKRVSRRYGNRRIWPGDTLGLSTRGRSAIVSWGSATTKRRVSQIYASLRR